MCGDLYAGRGGAGVVGEAGADEGGLGVGGVAEGGALAPAAGAAGRGAGRVVHQDVGALLGLLHLGVTAHLHGLAGQKGSSILTSIRDHTIFT